MKGRPGPLAGSTARGGFSFVIMSLTAPKEFNHFAARWLQGDNLQTRAQAALTTLKTIGRRRQSLDKSGNNRRVINKPLTSNGMLVGTLAKYVKGNNQAVIEDVEDDDDAEELEVTQLAPPASQPGKRNEFLGSVLYSGIYNNHVVLVQSAALKGKQLADHLNWLMEKVTPRGFACEARRSHAETEARASEKEGEQDHLS